MHAVNSICFYLHLIFVFRLYLEVNLDNFKIFLLKLIDILKIVNIGSS